MTSEVVPHQAVPCRSLDTSIRSSKRSSLHSDLMDHWDLVIPEICLYYAEVFVPRINLQPGMILWKIVLQSRPAFWLGDWLGGQFPMSSHDSVRRIFAVKCPPAMPPMEAGGDPGPTT